VALTPTYFDPPTLAKIRSLRLRARHVVEGYVSGAHRSPYQGYSIEFAEHREYSPGDDLRYVDWKVFGRTDKFYVKQFEDETNLIAYLVVDGSESMSFASDSDGLNKLGYAQTLAAVLALLVLQQQDAAALAVFDDQVRTVLRPSTSAAQLNNVTDALEAIEPTAKKTASGPIFHELAERFSKRGVVLILSDLLDDPDSLLAGLRHFRFRRHDVRVIQVLDPAEIEFPFQTPMLFRGLEDLPEVTADARAVRRAYLEELAAFQNHVRAACLDQGIAYHVVRCDEPIDAALTRILQGGAVRV